MNDDFSLTSDFLIQDDRLLTVSLEVLIKKLEADGKTKEAEWVQFKLHGLRSSRLLVETYTKTCENLLDRYSVLTK